jgi:hypothetical protein
MSLAITAAPFDNETPINKKKQGRGAPRNKTYKNSALNSDKVATVLESIHNSTADNFGKENSDDGLGDYFPSTFSDNNGEYKEAGNGRPVFDGPPPAPATKEPFKLANTSSPPRPMNNSQMELQSLNKAFETNADVSKYYTAPTVPSMGGAPVLSGDSVAIEKLNFIINLLEEQKDYRTNNVTEEVVLYSFLGIFVIFVVDSFAKVGKYTR